MEQFMPNVRDPAVTKQLKRLLLYCGCIIVLPLLSMFVVKKIIFEGIFQLSSTDASLYAAIVAVVQVHIILGLFVYAAWKEELPVQAPKRD